MPVHGEELIARIMSMIQVQSRKELRAIAAVFADAIYADFLKHGASAHTPEAFNLFRSAKREHFATKFRSDNSVEKPVPVEAILFPAMSSWGSFDQGDIREIYLRHEDVLDVQIKKLNATNTLRNHLLAVFRPFQERNLILWGRVLPESAISEVRARASDLAQELIRNQVELEAWKIRIWDLFYNTAVQRELTEPGALYQVKQDRQREQTLPSGFVGATTARIYKQRWDDWFEANLEELLRYVQTKTLSQPIRSDYRTNEASIAPERMKAAKAALSAVDTFSVGVERHRQEAPSEPQQRLTTQVSATVTLSLRSSNDDSLTTKNTWPSSEQAKQNIRVWLNLVEELWGPNKGPFRAAVSFEREGELANIDLPAGNSDEIATAVARVLDVLNK